jgi:ornithine carbamoyltransferase
VLNNVANSLIEITAACVIQLILVTPISNEGAEIESVLRRGLSRGTLVRETDLRHAVRHADYVYTDTWVDMEFFKDPSFASLKDERVELMLPYQINMELLSESKAKIMHDMPIHVGFEISREAVKSSRSIIFQQAENRLDAQKAVITKLLDGL